jgi:hypothetical protein
LAEAFQHNSRLIHFRVDVRVIGGNSHRQHHRASQTISSRAALDPEGDRLVAQLLVLVAHQVLEQRVRFLAGFMKAPRLGVVVETLPLAPMATRPSLTGPGPPLDLRGTVSHECPTARISAAMVRSERMFWLMAKPSKRCD